MKASSKYYLVRNLPDIRKEKYSSRKAIAEKAILSEKTIERAEKGKDRLELDSIELIASALGVKSGDIIDKVRSDEESKLDQLHIRKNDKKAPCLKLGMKNYSNINQVAQNINVRYMGRSGPIDLEDGDKLNTLFFTTDTDKTIDESKIDISMSMKESDFLKIVDKLYEEYRDKPLELQGLDESYLTKEELEILNMKIISLRLGENVTLRVIDDEYMEIIDFYPKGKLSHTDEIYRLVESLLCKIDENDNIYLTDAIIPSGFEKIDKIIRCSLRAGDKISSYVEENFVDYLSLRELFIQMTYILKKYMDNEMSAKEAQSKINSFYKEIKSKLYLLKKLDELYGFNRAYTMFQMMKHKDKIEKEFTMELNI